MSQAPVVPKKGRDMTDGGNIRGRFEVQSVLSGKANDLLVGQPINMVNTIGV
jgi:hypothetical protein